MNADAPFQLRAKRNAMSAPIALSVFVSGINIEDQFERAISLKGPLVVKGIQF